MNAAARTIASEEGFARFIAILDAQDAWRGMTKIQRATVSARLCDGPTSKTLAALERRGIVRDGLLTEWGDFVRITNIPPTESSGSASSQT
jgi:hypothetical protein